MESWEFLIQKQGDRTWLPLESPEVEILEGRYRVVARCNRPNENIEITVSHETTDEIPPKRRLQKRSRTTNAEGLIVVLPYTRLKPGIWELHCTDIDIISNTAGNHWTRSVLLEVLPVDEESIPLTPDGGQVEAEMPSLGDLEKQGNIVENIKAESSLGEVKQTPQQEDDKRFISATPNQQDTQTPPRNASASLQPKEQKLQLSLDRTTYMSGQGQSVIVSGKILAETDEPLSGCQLQIELRDPQTSRILAEVRLDIRETVAPIPFSCALNVPPDSQTRLILGEVKLYSDTATATPTDSKPFTITADLGDLFDEIVEQLNDQEFVDLSSEPFEKKLGEVLDQSYQELLETIDRNQPVKFEPASNTVLPPLLHKPNPTKATTKPLDLPSLPAPGSSPQPRKTPPSSPPQPAEESPSQGPVEQEQEETSQEIAPTSETFTPEPANAETETPVLSPVDEAFQSLNLPDRFWSRLNALATDEELTELLKADLPAPAPQQPNSETEIPSRPKTAQEWDYQEFVIEDEPTAPAPKKPQPAEKEEEPVFTLAKDEEVPVPVLELPKDPLIAGRTVKVKIRLPDIQPRIYVKVWLQDRSARLILDGPYWVTDFTPSIWGGKEGTVQLIIPYGSFEIQFEAISMEMHTQRESYKISISREVTPPSPPSLPLE
ncbi:hypothetical protein NG798_22370 [Ancylothrix sp. C2]|uniref:hypothetical protein n=1 Tax=Ancylothrix sp. D3o TaxID=2953691 RepID=UPI0021BA5628|nr:hypothetical protein [Ancylothrix sp. D3o]MCT7952545.1 hypothetical protein [Ancylothrix sp. D3o]